MKDHAGKKLILFIVLIGIVFFSIFVFLFQYQIVQGSAYAAQAVQNNQSVVSVKAARGEITDRYGRLLVGNRLSLNVSLNKVSCTNQELNQAILYLIGLFEQEKVPYQDEFPITQTQPYQFIAGEEDQAAALRSALGVQEYATADNCMNLLTTQCEIEGYDQASTRKIAAVRAQMLINQFSEQTPYVFAMDVSSQLAGKIMEQKEKVPGIFIAESTTRVYPDGTIAPHLLGTVGPIYQEEYKNYKAKGYAMNAEVGKSGIELNMEDTLHGSDGKKTVVKNEKGEILNEYYKDGEEPKPGNTVMLTIDKELQKKVQDALASFILSLRHTDKYRGTKGGAVAVLDVKTGEALALANYPGYDISQYGSNYHTLASDTTYKPLFNRVLMGNYRPGSTFKTCVAVGALTEGVINKNTIFNCVNPFMYYGSPFNCLQIHHSGPTNIYTAIQRSCNIYFYNTGDRLGISRINNYAHAFGLGTDTGLEITADTGHISSPDYYAEHGLRWEQGYVIQTAIGQSETMVTPLQMATSMMTLANRGVRYETHLIKTIEKYDYSATVKETQPVVASRLEDKNGAYDITTQGMKLMAQTVPNLIGIDIAAKSGTPEYYISNTVYKTNSAAIAFYPASNPEIAISIMIEEGESAPQLLRSIVEAYESCKTISTENMPPVNQLRTS